MYWIDVATPDGQRIRSSSGTKDRKLAQQFHDTFKAKLWKFDKLGEKPDRSWQESVVRFINETKYKASHKTDLYHLNWLHKYLSTKNLSDINRDFVDYLKQSRLSEGVSNASVNRILALLKSILRKAKNDWEWIDKIPHIRLLPEPKRRIRWITYQEAQSLINELPEHLSLVVRFSLATGLRQSNAKNLEWSQIDLERSVCWIHPDQAKAREAICVPLNSEAMDVLLKVRGRHSQYAFTYREKPIKQLTTKAWYKALKRAGIENFKWHDLRHTWASWHAQNETPMNVLQELGGWESAEMVRRYAHLSSTHLAKYSENSNGFSKSTSQCQKQKRLSVS